MSAMKVKITNQPSFFYGHYCEVRFEIRDMKIIPGDDVSFLVQVNHSDDGVKFPEWDGRSILHTEDGRDLREIKINACGSVKK